MSEQKLEADACVINKCMLQEMQHTLGEHSLGLIYIKITKVTYAQSSTVMEIVTR